MRNTLETRLGIFFALCFIGAVVVLEMVGVADYFKPGYRVHADFKNVLDLKQGDLVRMAGVEVGRVDRIALTNDLVRVTMKIKKPDADLRVNSKATIKFTGLMGQNYVAIDFGTHDSPKAHEGAILTATEQGDLSSLMTKLETVADQVTVLSKDLSSDSLANLLGPITGFLENERTNLSAIITNTRKVTEQVAAGEGTVGKMVFDLSLYNRALAAVTGMEAGVTELKAVATDARSLLSEVNTGKGTLGLLVRDDALYRESTNAMTNVREILQKMNQGQGTVGKLINDDSFYKNAKVSLQKLDKATESLEDHGPLSVIGIMMNGVF